MRNIIILILLLFMLNSCSVFIEMNPGVKPDVRKEYINAYFRINKNKRICKKYQRKNKKELIYKNRNVYW